MVCGLVRSRCIQRAATKSRHQRPFVTIPGSNVQSLTATRILPYPSHSVYQLITDVDSYATFLPYCTASKVTSWSSPDAHDTRWPSRADLTVGYGAYSATFTSKLFCVPGSVVEAHSGTATAATSIPREQLAHHQHELETPPVDNDVFESLWTRWTVRPFHYLPPSGHPQTDSTQHQAREETEVHLAIEFKFANPMYGMLSQAVTPTVAATMVDAFEKRARLLLDGPGAGLGEEKRAFVQKMNAQ